MSSITSSPRRPNTALTTPLSSTRLPYEAAEALLWERQNARLNTHLHAQMKELQAAHDAYDARIKATEAVAEAAEAAVSTVKELERKVKAIEEDEREGPFVRWAKEAVGQLQISVDGMKGVRQRVSALDGMVVKLGEDVEKVRDEGGVAKNVLRRLEVLEGERKEEGGMIRELEREVTKLKEGGQRRGDSRRRGGENEEMVEEAYDEAPVDDNPLAVFYGIETQSSARRQESPTRHQDHERSSTAAYQQGRSPSRLAESPTRRQASPLRRQDPTRTGTATRHQNRSPSRLASSAQRRYDNLLPPGEDVVQPDDNSFELLHAAPNIEYGWENTQQFKDMQKELEALRAMCRSQETKSSNETADTTQRPQETQLVRRENNIDFSDATTETEAEYNGKGICSHQGVPQGSVDASSSDIQLPSSPPKRTETQSARHRLMKRPSICDPRVPSTKEQVQPERVALVSREQPAQITGPSHMVRLPVRLPVEAYTTGKASSKRKRVEDESAQRVPRPRLSNDKAASKRPVVPTARAKRTIEDVAPAEDMPFAVSEQASAQLSPARKTYGKQKPAANHPIQQAAPQAGPSGPEQPTLPAVKPAVLAAEAVKSRKTVNRPKPKAKPISAQQQPHEATASSSKKTSAVVKKETNKGPRQPAGACKSCRSRHQKCDRAQPTCDRCAKLGTSCEYPQTSAVTTQNAARASSPNKKQALLPIKKSSDEAGRASVRERSVTISPVAPRQKGPGKGTMPPSLSKKPTVTAAPTAASSRAPRARNTQKSGASRKKK
ncbi:hypothetical protein E8E11_009727 [Didymella keratinophila]|nr:hypothetical protein E8E11_009727 [Didymella keratinophila]